MNGHCNTCDREKDCGYAYKPCDCRDYLKFKVKGEQQAVPQTDAQIIPFPVRAFR